MYHLPCVCRTLVPKIHARHKMLCVFRYIDMLTCVINKIELTARMTGTSLARFTHVCHEEYQRRQVGECADKWYKQTDSAF